jgi:hypothetical protein
MTTQLVSVISVDKFKNSQLNANVHLARSHPCRMWPKLHCINDRCGGDDDNSQ